MLMLEGCTGGAGEALVAHSRKVTPQPHMSASMLYGTQARLAGDRYGSVPALLRVRVGCGKLTTTKYALQGKEV